MSRSRTPSPPPLAALELARVVLRFPAPAPSPGAVPRGSRSRTPSPPPLRLALDGPSAAIVRLQQVRELEARLARVRAELEQAKAQRPPPSPPPSTPPTTAPPSSAGEDGPGAAARGERPAGRRESQGSGAPRGSDTATLSATGTGPGRGRDRVALCGTAVRRCLSSEKDCCSKGSLGHPHCCQSPCLFFWRGLCTLGAACDHCHHPHTDREARRPRLNRRSRHVVEQLPFLDQCALVEPLLLQKLSATDQAKVKPVLRKWKQLPPKQPKSLKHGPLHPRIALILGAKSAGGLLEHLRQAGLAKLRAGPKFLFEADALRRDLEPAPTRRRSASPLR